MFQRIFATFLSPLALLAASLLAAPAAFGGDGKFTATEPPAPLPGLSFEDGKGRGLDIKDFKGRTVILNLWATWCSPCVAEMPAINELSKQLDPKKFAVVTVAEDHDGAAAAEAFFKRHGIDHLAVYADRDGMVPFALKAHGLPTTVLVNPAGLEIARLEGGADWNSGAIKSYLEENAR